MEMKEYKYAMVNRPASIGSIPTDGFLRAEDRPAKGEPHHDYARHGIAVFSRPLTDAETLGYEIAPLVSGDVAMIPYADAVIEDMGRYKKAYLYTYDTDDSDNFKVHVVESLKALVSKGKLGGYRPSLASESVFVALVAKRLRDAVASEVTA